MIEPNGRDNSANKVNPLAPNIPFNEGKDALSLPPHPLTNPTQSPAEQAEALIKRYCEGTMTLMDEKGRAARQAQHLPWLNHMLLGPSKDPRLAEPWQKIPKNSRYDEYVVEILGAAVDPHGNDHLFVSLTNSRNEQIVPRQEIADGKIKWNLKDPLMTSRTHFCGIHFIIESFARQDGSFGRSITPVPILPPLIINREIDRTLKGAPETLLRRALADSAKRHLSDLPTRQDSPARVAMQIGNQSRSDRMEMLGTNPLGERIAIIAAQTSPLHFDFLAEVPFTAQSHDAFLLGRAQGSRKSGSITELCSYLYGSKGALLASYQGARTYDLLSQAVHRRLLQRYQSVRSIEKLTFAIEGAIINQEENTGVLCVSFKDSAGTFVIPGDGGTFATSEDPSMLVVMPTIRHKLHRNQTANSLQQPALPWLVENSTRVGRAEKSFHELEASLSGIVCSEQFFCTQMDILARRPTESIFESRLIDRVRGQLRQARLPINKLECSVVDLAGEQFGTQIPHRGFALMGHSFGKSLLALNRDKKSGFVALHRPAVSDALFIET